MVAQIRLQLSEWFRETSLRDGAPLKSADLGTRVADKLQPPMAERTFTVRPSVATLKEFSAGTTGDGKGSVCSGGVDNG